jgi:hypothetical protein
VKVAGTAVHDVFRLRLLRLGQLARTPRTLTFQHNNFHHQSKQPWPRGAPSTFALPLANLRAG